MPRQFTLIGCALTLAIALSAAWNDGLAESAYRWKDASGNWMYGSKPPPGARSVEVVGGKSFSKYSSDKLIKAFQPANIPSPPVEARGSLMPDPLRESDLVSGLARLEHETVSFDLNGKRSEI